MRSGAAARRAAPAASISDRGVIAPAWRSDAKPIRSVAPSPRDFATETSSWVTWTAAAPNRPASRAGQSYGVTSRWRPSHARRYHGKLRVTNGGLKGGERPPPMLASLPLCLYIVKYFAPPAPTVPRPAPALSGDRDMSHSTLLKRPSAFLPLALAFAALATVLVHVSVFGAAREADEGTAAHLWQLLMGGQLPIVAFFAIKWLPRDPRQGLIILALQAGAGLAALAPVFLLHL